MPVVAVAQVRQETNTFNPTLTRLADYERYGLIRDPAEIARRYRDTDELGGFFAVLATRPDIEVRPLCRAVAWSGGRLAEPAWDALHEAVCRPLREGPRPDGVLLSLHGATASEHTDDVCGHLVAAVREVVGASVPIAVSLDLHANLTGRLVTAADFVVGYQTMPHLDMVTTGERTARLLLAMMAGQARPVTAMRKVPALLGVQRQSTFEGPLATLFGRLAAAEEAGEVLTASCFPVQPWLDVEHLGSAVLVTTNGDAATANRLADTWAEELWSIRGACDEALTAVTEVVAQVAAAERWPVVISDGADATNSGAPGDSTVLARAFLTSGCPGPLLCSVVDPEAAQACAAAGIGARLTLTVGGRQDPATGPPLEVTGEVAALTDGNYTITGHGGTNLPVAAGLSAALRCGELTLAITSGSIVGSHPGVYRNLGLEPAQARAVVVKSPFGFRHDYGPFAAAILLADCPGAATANYHRLGFTRGGSELWPLRAWDDWRAAPCCNQNLIAEPT